MASLLTQLPIEENVACSPLSVRMALAMLVPGARGETREQLEQFVGSDTPEHVSALLDRFRGEHEDATRLTVANGAFLGPDLRLLAAYREVIDKSFHARLENLDFGDPGAAAAHISRWAEQATEGMISNLVGRGDVSDLTGLALVNAVYFLAKWRTPFQDRRTTPEPFHPLTGSARKVPMMRQTCDLPHLVDRKLGVEAVRMPYHDASLVVLLPDPGRFEEVARSVGEVEVATLAGRVELERQVDIRLPRFEIESRASLSDVLSRLGVRTPFDPNQADFGAMTDHPEGLYLEQVLHGARIRVDEQGTEAAAATAAMMSFRGISRGPVAFHVDRPFLFFVYDEQSRTVIFAGRCVQPS